LYRVGQRPVRNIIIWVRDMNDGCPYATKKRKFCKIGENQPGKHPVCLRNTHPRKEDAYPVSDDKSSGLAEIRETGEALSYGSAPPDDICALPGDEIMICDDPLLEGSVEFTLSDMLDSLSISNLENLLEIQRSRNKQRG
jgi:hypothetical protein